MSVHVVPAPGELAKGSWLDSNVFTDIAFETGCGLLQLEERHVFVTSISGAVYQVRTRQPCVSPAFVISAFVVLLSQDSLIDQVSGGDGDQTGASSMCKYCFPPSHPLPRFTPHPSHSLPSPAPHGPLANMLGPFETAMTL